MEEKINKRKIKRFKNLEGQEVYKKKIILEDKNEISKNETIEAKKDKNPENKTNIVGKFQLVVIKLPWYKKAWRAFLGFLGFRI